MKLILTIAVALVLGLVSCSSPAKNADTDKVTEVRRIVSLSGTITEVIYELNAEKELVAVDVTSTFPAAAEKLTNLGHIRGITAEGIVAAKPTHVLAFEDEMNPALKDQLKKLKVEVVLFKRDYTVKSAKKVITDIAKWLDKEEAAEKLTKQIDKDVASVKKLAKAPRVLFVYARGTGTLMVAGDNTQLSEMIKLAGGTNATGGFEDFKPLTAEAVVAANPDVILMFDSGKSSLSSEGGILAVPGVKLTNAGKNQAFISMDGQYLSGFGPRVGKALVELNTELGKIN